MKLNLIVLLMIGVLFVSACSPSAINGGTHDSSGDTDSGSGELRQFSMTAKQWEFSPSTITVNEGDTIRLIINSVDVSHGFSLPDFGINKRLDPGNTIIVEFVADKKGTFTFRCSVQCGAGHNGMTGTLIVQ